MLHKLKNLFKKKKDDVPVKEEVMTLDQQISSIEDRLVKEGFHLLEYERKYSYWFCIDISPNWDKNVIMRIRQRMRGCGDTTWEFREISNTETFKSMGVYKQVKSSKLQRLLDSALNDHLTSEKEVRDKHSVDLLNEILKEK